MARESSLKASPLRPHWQLLQGTLELCPGRATGFQAGLLQWLRQWLEPPSSMGMEPRISSSLGGGS